MNIDDGPMSSPHLVEFGARIHENHLGFGLPLKIGRRKCANRTHTKIVRFRSDFIQGLNTHDTGCTVKGHGQGVKGQGHIITSIIQPRTAR